MKIIFRIGIVLFATIVILIIAIYVGNFRDAWQGDYSGWDVNYAPEDPGAIEVTSIIESGSVSQQFTLEGNAFGDWFSEGGMTAEVRAPDGSVLWEGEARADGFEFDAMNRFTAEIDVGTYRGAAEIVLRRGDESGDPRFQQTFTVSVAVE